MGFFSPLEMYNNKKKQSSKANSQNPPLLVNRTPDK